MFLAFALVAVSLVAHIWLWRNWSFEESLNMNLLLAFNSLVLFYVLVAPVFRFFKKKSLKDALNFWPIKISFYIVICLTLVLGFTHFYGWIKYIMLAKTILLTAFTFYKFKRRKKLKNRG